MADHMKPPESCRTSCSPCSPRSCSQPSQRAPRLSNNCRTVIQTVPKSCSGSRDSGRCWPFCCRVRPSLVNVWPNPSKLCRFGPHMFFDLGRTWPTFGLFPLNVVELCPTMAKLDKISEKWPSLVSIGNQHVGQPRPRSALIKPESAKFGRTRPNFGQLWSSSVKRCPTPARLGFRSTCSAIVGQVFSNCWTFARQLLDNLGACWDR